MKCALLLLVCSVLVGCGTTRHLAAKRVLTSIDADLSEQEIAADFEYRLDQLGAKIETGANPGERTTSFPAQVSPARAGIATRPLPGYFPPRIVRVVYIVSAEGTVTLQSADVISLGSRFGQKNPDRPRGPT
jgi:hypothetical protein